MRERLTWKEIKENYPDQWVGLDEIEWEPDNRSTIKSAVVAYGDKDRKGLTKLQIETHGKIIARYTTPDHEFQVGVMEVG